VPCVRRARGGCGDRGLSDLAIGGHKVSGNAQRRKREAILHHGTLLYRPDYAGMARWLREPAKRPDYRGARDHRAFVGTLPLERGALETCTAEAFGATRETAATDAELKVMRTLAAEKYATETWSRRR